VGDARPREGTRGHVLAETDQRITHSPSCKKLADGWGSDDVLARRDDLDPEVAEAHEPSPPSAAAHAATAPATR
jgi:hypothetical protein